MKKLGYTLVAVGIAGMLLTTPAMTYSINETRAYQITPKKQELETVVNITTARQLETIIKQNEKVAIDFGSTLCGPCKTYSPLFAEAAREYENKIIFCKVVLDQISNSEENKIIKKYYVYRIPKTMFFKNGKEIHSFLGGRNKDVLKGLIDYWLLEKADKP